MRKLLFRISRYYHYFLLVIPFLIFVRGISGFPYPSQDAAYSDLAITHFPNAVYLKNQIMMFGKIPLWSPLIFSGYPFFANPLSGLWYPPGWLALFFPLPLGLNLVAGLHLLWGTLGFNKLLRSEGLSSKAAQFGAIVFAFTPKLFAHYGAGHLTLIYAVAWTPWLLWSARKSMYKGGRWYILPSMIMAMICLADPRWIIFAGLLWFAYSFAHRQLISREMDFPNRHNKNFSFKVGQNNQLLHLLIMSTQAIIAIMLACPLLIPLYEYTGLSTRSWLTQMDSLEFSLPPGRLLGLLFPDFGGNHEHMVYVGSSIFALVLVSLLMRHKQKAERFWIWVGAIALLYALGSNLPFAPLLTSLPGFSLLRVPSRTLFITSISFGAISSHRIDAMLTAVNYHDNRFANLLLTALVTFAITMAAGVWFISGEVPLPFVFGSCMVLAIYILIRIFNKGILPPNTWYALLLVLTVIDLGVVDFSVLTYKSKDEVLSFANQATTYIQEQDGLFRVYSPSYSLHQSVAAINSIESADGVDPLQLFSYSEYMQEATGVPSLGYGVTIPPFQDGTPETANIAYAPDPFLLGQLNVRFVVSEFPLNVEGLELREKFGSTYIYENLLHLPRAWVNTENSSFEADIEPVTVSFQGPNRIEVTATGPGSLVLSEIYYPGWKASINGSQVEIDSINGIFRSVKLDTGVQSIIFTFFPLSIQSGLAIFSFGLFLILFFWFILVMPRSDG